MKLVIGEATTLAVRVLTRSGLRETYARMVADHLVDAALAGHEFSSLARLLFLAETLRERPPEGEVRTVKETATSALIDGGGNLAYVVGSIAIDHAIRLCRSSGIATVCANNTWSSGRLAYYVERAARQGYVAMHAISGTARTAPFGGMDPLLGTNPIAFAFPSDGAPVIVDMSMSAITHGRVNLAKAKNEKLPDGVAIDSSGIPTTDPDTALNGAFRTWGGHRGYGISLAVQMLGMLAGSDPVIRDETHYGLFFLVLDPALLSPDGNYRSRISELRETINASRPAAGNQQVRMPGDHSLARREAAMTANATISLDDNIYARILELAN